MMLEIEQLAARQLRDYDARTPGTMFAEPITLDVQEAYAIQAAVGRLREQRGERLIGYKVGCTSPTIQERLGIGHPVYARLFEGERRESGAELRATQFANLAIEGELAVRLQRDLAVDASQEELWDAIESVFAVIELHNLVFRRASPSAEELIANNAVHAGFVHATDPSPFPPDESSSLRINVDYEKRASVSGAESMRTVLDSLRWLGQELNRRGDRALTGQTILCGSVADVFPVSAGSRVSVLAGDFGSVQCRIY